MNEQWINRSCKTLGKLGAAFAFSFVIWAQPPGGGPGAGGPPPATPNAPPSPAARAIPLAGLTAGEAALFEKGLAAFSDTEGVPNGIGPRFNHDSCGGCHSAPAIGGSSPSVNPQLTAATRLGARNTIPPFITQNGPVRVVRFKRDKQGRPDGGVQALFVITGRSDAPAACAITQPDFSNPANHSLRIPTPVFGAGLMEAISDSTLRTNLAANATRKQQLGITGRLNTNGNDGTVTRFGWKAQNKSLDIFSGEAYNVEMGVTNELFPQEREEDQACATNGSMEDHYNADTNELGDKDLFTRFMRFLAPPPIPQPSAAASRGRALFDSVGCAMCHTPTLRTSYNTSAALSNQPVALYSDLALHNMGNALNDDVAQGEATGQDWRTAPLWGLKDRLFFLHDGRTRDLHQAILIHSSIGSEANQVIGNYHGLSATQREDLLTFLLTL
jgi:CxxC motif-containing protein (DUF1111 family)